MHVLTRLLCWHLVEKSINQLTFQSISWHVFCMAFFGEITIDFSWTLDRVVVEVWDGCLRVGRSLSASGFVRLDETRGADCDLPCPPRQDLWRPALGYIGESNITRHIINDHLNYRSLFDLVYPLSEVKPDKKSPDILGHKTIRCSLESFNIVANRIHTDNPRLPHSAV